MPEATVTQMAVNIHGVHGVTNAAAGVGGADEESDADLWARYHERRTEPITSGNANHYVMWAKEVTGVSYARCIPLWNGNGTVKVIIAGADKKPLDDTIVTACAEHIEAERPIGATVTVVSVTEVEIPIVAKIKLVNGHSLDEVKADLSAAVSALLAALPFADPFYFQWMWQLLLRYPLPFVSVYQKYPYNLSFHACIYLQFFNQP